MIWEVSLLRVLCWAGLFALLVWTCDAQYSGYNITVSGHRDGFSTSSSDGLGNPYQLAEGFKTIANSSTEGIPFRMENLPASTTFSLSFTKLSDTGHRIGWSPMPALTNQSTLDGSPIEVRRSISSRVGILAGDTPGDPYTVSGTVEVQVNLHVPSGGTVVDSTVFVVGESGGTFSMTTNGDSFSSYSFVNPSGLPRIHLYGDGVVPDPRPESDPAPGEIVNIEWTVSNFASEAVTLYIETADDIPVSTVAGIIPGEEWFVEAQKEFSPDFQLKVDETGTGDTGSYSVVFVDGTAIYTVPGEGQGPGTWVAEYVILSSDDEETYKIRFNFAMKHEGTSEFTVNYAGIPAFVFELSRPSVQTSGMALHREDVILNAPQALPLSFDISEGFAFEILAGPSRLVAGGVNLYDVVIYESGQDAPQILQRMEEHMEVAGEQIHVSGTYEEQNDDGSSFYWSTGVAGFEANNKTSTPVIRAEQNKEVRLPKNEETFEQRVERERAQEGLKGIDDIVGQAQAAALDEGAFGGLKGLFGAAGAGADGMTQRNVWEIQWPDFLGYLAVPAMVIKLDEPPVTTVRLLLLWGMCIAFIVSLVRFLKV